MDILLVANRDDTLATHLAQTWRQYYEVGMYTMEEAAALFSITVTTVGVLVTPDLPTLFRGRPMAPMAHFDADFLNQEAQATTWAALATARSPVINRPNVWGPASKLAASPYITELRAGLTPRTEVHHSGTYQANVRDGKAPLWSVELHSGATSKAAEATLKNGVYRTRPGIQDPGYEEVVVLGTQAWRRSTAPAQGLDLESKSIAAARRLKLDFALVGWLLNAHCSVADVAYIDSMPQTVNMGAHLPAIAHALLGRLTS